jgi:hypothetical protein
LCGTLAASINARAPMMLANDMAPIIAAWMAGRLRCRKRYTIGTNGTAKNTTPQTTRTRS